MSEPPGQIEVERPRQGLLTALLALRAEAPRLPRDKTAKVQTRGGGSYSYSYTSLDTIADKIDPLLIKHGLVWIAMPVVLDSGKPGLAYQLTHAPSGESVAGTMKLVGDIETAQVHGSGITYARRYAKVAVLDLVAEDDDDGAAASPVASMSRVGGSATVGANAGSAPTGHVNLQDRAKGLRDDQIAWAFAQIGRQAPERPWGALRAVEVGLAQQLGAALDTARSAG